MFFTLVLLCLVLQHSMAEIKEAKFYASQICDIQMRMEQGCSTVFPVRSMTECLSVCLDHDTCVGASVDETNSICFKHSECSSLPVCVRVETKHSYKSKMCDGGRVWQPATTSCQCVNGWVGMSCPNYPRSCADLIPSGYPKGHYRTVLDPEQDGRDLIDAECYLNGNYANLAVLWNDGTQDFNKTWEEYRDGFYESGDPGKRMLWIGLKNLHAAIESGYRDLYFVLTVDGLGVVYSIYYNFRILDESQNFAFTFSTFDDRDWDPQGIPIRDLGNDLNDCLGQIKNTPFSAWDKDQDTDGNKNCALMTGSGWWYKDCNNLCNLCGWGTRFLASKPPNQLMHVSGVDMNTLNAHDVNIYMYMVK